MKANPEKSYALLSFKTPKKACFGETLVESSSNKKLIINQIDSDLTFDKHISSICNKVGKKINVLSHLFIYAPFDKCVPHGNESFYRIIVYLFNVYASFKNIEQ